MTGSPLSPAQASRPSRRWHHWSSSTATTIRPTPHQQMRTGKPIYGMHRGTVGFLMNEFSARDLHARLAAAKESVIHPLLMRAVDVHGVVHVHHAINEVALF